MGQAGELALIFLALAGGGFLKGAVGAGAPVIAVPVLVLFFDVPFAVSVMVIPNLVSNIYQGWQFRKEALPWRFTWIFALATVLGAGVGTVILATLPQDVLLIGTAGAVFAYIGFRLARPHWILAYGAASRLLWPAGVTSGILQGATGISAPVIVTFLSAMRLRREQFIATISVSFGAMSALQIPTLWAFGILDGARSLYGILAIAPLIGFMPLGSWSARFLSPKLFDRVILVLLAAIAVRMVWKALA